MNAKEWTGVKYLGYAVSVIGLFALVGHAKQLETEREALLKYNTELLDEAAAPKGVEFIKTKAQNAVFMCSPKLHASKAYYIVENVTDYRQVDDMWEFHGGGMLYRLYQQGDEVCSVEVD